MKRTDFLAAASAGASVLGSGAVAAAAEGGGVPGGSDLVERRANFDMANFESILGRPADYRFVWEEIAIAPPFFNNVKNALNGLVFGFGVDPSRIVMAVAGHGPSASYGYSDYVWQKYRIGEFFAIKDAAGAPVTTNAYLAKRATNASTDPNDVNGPLQDTSIQALQARGVVFLTCHTAVEEQSRAIVKRGFAPTGMTGSDVAADILTHLIPGALVVPSMVATIGLVQTKWNYSYLTIT